MAPQKMCVFCQKIGVPMSVEHVFARWLGQLFPSSQTQCSYLKFSVPRDGQTTIEKQQNWEAPANDTGIKFGRVCVPCNTGWMARLESAAMPILTPLIKGESRVIKVAEQAVIVRWAMKMALIFDIMRPSEAAPFFTEQDRKAMTLETDFQFFPVVILAPYHGPQNGLGVFFVHLFYGAHVNEQGSVSLDQIEFHMTLNLGRLAIQLMCLLPNPKGPGVRFKPVSPLWRDYTVEITESTMKLPKAIRDVSWPPPKALDDDLFMAFRDRWMLQHLIEGHLGTMEEVLARQAKKE